MLACHGQIVVLVGLISCVIHRMPNKGSGVESIPEPTGTSSEFRVVDLYSTVCTQTAALELLLA